MIKNTPVSFRRQLLRGLIPCLAALLAAATARGQSAYFTAVQNLDPAAYWPLQETNQPPGAFIETNIGSLGAVGNMYYSSLGTTVLEGESSALASDSDNSVKFNGAGGFGLVPTTDNRVSLPAGGPFTVELWAQPSENGNYQGILGQRGNLGNGGNNNADTMAGWEIGENYVPLFDDGNGALSGALQGWSFAVFSGGSPYIGAQALAPYDFQDPLPQPNGWYYLVAVFDGVNASMYVNGVLASANSSTPMPAGASFAPDTWDPMEIAASRGFAANAWTGFLDEVAIYTNALKPSQIANHYFQATNTVNAPNSNYKTAVLNDGAYMYWRMDAPNVTPNFNSGFPVATNYGSLASSMQNLNTGVNGASAGYYQPATIPGMPGPSYAGFGSPSYAVAFNGLNGAVDAGFNSAMNQTGTSGANSFTVVGWFKGNPFDDNSRFNSLFVHGNASWRATIDNGTTHFNYGPAASDLVGPAININDGNWHMFAGIYNETNSIQTVIIDGAVSNSSAASTAIVGDPSYDIMLGGSPDYTIAGPTYYNSAQRFAAGEMAHVAYFTSALTAAQIQGLYTAAEAPPLIVTQPAAGTSTNSGGTTNVFTVTASGASTLVYQWYLTNSSGLTQLADNGASIVGSASNILTLTNLADSQSGSYFVIVGNSYGSVTSAMSGMQVFSQPLIVSQTPGTSALQLYTNQSYNLSVTAIGASPLTYQWYTNGVADTTSGTGSTYAVNGGQAGISGTTYYCVVANGFAPAATNTLTTLTVASMPANLTSSAYGSTILGLSPSGYWPMHEVEPGVKGDVETNLGTLGTAGTAYYGDWDVNFAVPMPYPEDVPNFGRQVGGALANDPDGATYFDRSEASYLVIPHSSPQTTIKPPFTVEAWVYPGEIANYGIIVGQGGGAGINGGANYGGFDLIWSGTTNSFSLAVYNGSGSSDNEYKTVSVYLQDQWYHVVGTYDGTNIGLYVNGTTPPPTAAFPSGYQSGTNVYSPFAPDSWSPLTIGCGRWTAGNPGGPADLFGGSIDEVAVYTNVLSTNVINQHYVTGTTGAAGQYKSSVLAADPLLYYRMDAPAWVQPPKSTWAVLNNYGTNAGNGVYTPDCAPGTQVANLGGLSSTAVTPLGGMGQFADCGPIATAGDNDLNFNAFSYTALFKTWPADGRAYQSIMSDNDGTVRSEIRGNTGAVQAHGGADETSSSTGFNDGNWHQMVMVAQVNSTTKTFTNILFIDGVQQASGTSTSSNNPAAFPGPEALIGNEYGFNITNGSPNTNTYIGSERCFAGTICEAAFFNYALPTNIVPNLYVAAGLPPFFSVQPTSAVVNEGSAYTNKSFASAGSALLASAVSYQWYTNGAPISGQNSSNLIYNSVVPSDANSDYYCVATSSYGSATSSVVSLSVVLKPTIFSYQPGATNDLLLLLGTSCTFSVNAGGQVPLTYYWTSNNVAVSSGVNDSNFVVNPITLGSAGTYSCLVSNSVSTAGVTWVIGVSSQISAFDQEVLSLNPIGYWRLDETEQGGGDQGVVCHDYVQGNNGSYSNVVLGNPGFDSAAASSPDYDPETSVQFDSYATANSLVFGIPNIDFSTPTGGNATYTIQAWALSTGSSGNTPTVVSKGNYYGEELTLDAGNALKWRFSLVTPAATDINANSGVNCNDSQWHFLVGVCDEVHSNVTLYIDGTNAATASVPLGTGIISNPSLPMTFGSRSSTTGSGGAFNEELTGYMNNVAVFNYALTSNQVQAEYFAAGVAPSFVQQPPSITNVNSGSTLVIPALAQGSAPLTYQWLDGNNGNAPLSGATNATLVISNITTSDTFTLAASNPYGTNDSTSVYVNVVAGAPELVGDIAPATAEVLVGGSVTFTAQIDGTVPLTNGWQLNGNAVNNSSRVSGATTQTLTINNVQQSDAGMYQLFTTNAYGHAASSQAALVVLPNLQFAGGIGWQGQGTQGSSLWVNNNTLQLTFDTASEANSAFFGTPVYVGAFDASFLYQATTLGSLADGITFCIQNDPRGAAAVGPGGGGFGYGNAAGEITPSVAFQINLYSGAAGGIGVAFGTDGSVGPNGSSSPVVFDTGDIISNYVSYADGLVSVIMTDTTAGTTFTTNMNANIASILGTNTAYVGFTGGTGSDDSSQQVSYFSFVSLPTLSAAVSAGNILISWPTGVGAYMLEQSPVLGPSATWLPVSATPAVVNGQNQVSLPLAGKASFYQLVVTNVPSF